MRFQLFGYVFEVRPVAPDAVLSAAGVRAIRGHARLTGDWPDENSDAWKERQAASVLAFREAMKRMAGEVVLVKVSRRKLGRFGLVVNGSISVTTTFASYRDLLDELARHGLTIGDCDWS